MTEAHESFTDPQYLRIIVKALHATLLEYLLPQPVINASPLLKSESREFTQIDAAAKNGEMIQELVDCLLEDESDEAELSLELRNVLHKLHDSPIKDHINCLPEGKYGAEKISNTLILTLNGFFLRELSNDTACKICSMMCEKKFISKKSCQLAEKKGNAPEIVLEVLKNIRPRKPDWPFEFFEFLQNTQKFQTEMKDIEKKKEELKAISTKAAKALETSSKLSSKFSDLETIFNDLKKKQEDDLTNFSDEFSDSDDDDSNSDAGNRNLSLRNYQKELAYDALAGKNTIICAPTGSGKTRVATHIILEHLKEKKEGKLKKKVAFLARTVPLVMQQFKSLKKYLPSKYKMENVTGDSEYSMSLHKFLDNYDVFVMTPRILENHVTPRIDENNVMKPLIPHGLAAFSLLVFDECHHTRKGEAYNTLMLSYLHTRKEFPEDMPQVVGLTASIGVEKAKDVSEAEKSILQICSNLDTISISTVKEYEQEMRELVPVPEEKIIMLQERPDDMTVGKIYEIMKSLEKRALQDTREVQDKDLDALMKKIPQDKKSQQYGQWVVMMEKKATSIARQPQRETNTSIRTLQIIAKHLKAYNVALDLYDLVQWREVLQYLEKCFSPFSERIGSLTVAEQAFYSLFQGLKNFPRTDKKSNRNLKNLRKVIKENLLPLDERTQSENSQVSKGIIFVKTRFIAYALTSWMEHCSDGFLNGLGTSVFTGTEASEDEGGMTSTQQEEIIGRFMDGDLRLLVATSVAEEGLDIPECNLVIKYNHVGNEVTTVQMRGRSRRKGGKSVLLAFDSICKKEQINKYNTKMMEEAVKNVSNMLDEDIRKKNKKNQDEILKNDEIDKLFKKMEKGHIEKQFKMVCKMCRQVVVDSQDIKLIDDSHHVVTNSDFFMNVEKRPNKSLHVMGEMSSYGYAICKGEPEKQAMCGNYLGFLMIFNKVPFLVLKVKSFGFETDGVQGLVYYNSWKNVPYRIKDIEKEDIQRCLPHHKTNVKAEENDSSLLSVSVTAPDLDKRNNPGHQEVAPDRDTSHLQTFHTEDSVAETNSRSNSSTGESTTEAKVVEADPESPNRQRNDTKDSGFLSNKGSKEANNSEEDQSITHLKMAPKNAEVLSQHQNEVCAANMVNVGHHNNAGDQIATGLQPGQQEQFLAEYPPMMGLLHDTMSEISSHLIIPTERIEHPESSLSAPKRSYCSSEED